MHKQQQTANSHTALQEDTILRAWYVKLPHGKQEPFLSREAAIVYAEEWEGAKIIQAAGLMVEESVTG